MNTYNITNRRNIWPGTYWFHMTPDDPWEIVEITARATILFVNQIVEETLHDLVEHCPEFEMAGPLEPPA
jgi:hypothetical protein